MSFLINPYIFAAGGCSGNIVSLSALTAYYKLEDATDSSGYGKDLTNTSVTFGEGKFDDAAIFNEADTSSNYNYRLSTTTPWISNSDSTNASGITLSCWIRFKNVPTGSNASRIFWIRPGGHRNIDLLYQPISSIGLQIVFFNGATAGTGQAAWTPTADTWYHIAYVQQPSTGAYVVYKDGSSFISGTNTTDGNAGTEVNCIGNHGTALNSTFLGRIDDFAVWERALSSDEIQTIYESTCPVNT